MSLIQKLLPMGVDEYLEGEKISEIRHEYVEGNVYAMVGASNFHNLIAGSIYTLLRTHLKGSPCCVFISDMKVRVGDDFYYPDVLVACDPSVAISYYVVSPLTIIEVLSTSTAARDRFEKRLAYQRLDSLQEYVLVEQERLEVEVIRRVADGWESERYGNGETVQLHSVGLGIPIEAMYEGVLDMPGDEGQQTL